MPEEAPAVLYHFTAPTTTHLGSILAEGEIRTTESNLSLERHDAGPRVVWLTTSEDLADASWQGPDPGHEPKEGARLAVAVEDARPWREWATEHGMDAADMDDLASSGGDPETWWIVAHPIRRYAIRELLIRPTVLGGKAIPGGVFRGDELRNLFQSAGARRALGLPTLPVRRLRVERAA